MRRFVSQALLCTLALAGSLACGTGSARTAESPLAGTWDVSFLLGPQEYHMWLVQIEDKGGKPEAKVLAAGIPNFKETTIEGLKASDKSIQMTLKAAGNEFQLTAYLPKGEATPKALLGSLQFRGNRDFARMERTDAKEIDPAAQPGDGAENRHPRRGHPYRLAGDHRRDDGCSRP